MKAIQYKKPKLYAVAEPAVLYSSIRNVLIFSPADFGRLAEKLAFTQSEWADILHISDRTLQRYLKENKPFEGLFAEHLHQIDKMADMGLEVFGESRALEEWLRSSKTVLGKTIDFTTLRSFGGVQLIGDELGRIAHGVYI